VTILIFSAPRDEQYLLREADCMWAAPLQIKFCFLCLNGKHNGNAGSLHPLLGDDFLYRSVTINELMR